MLLEKIIQMQEHFILCNHNISKIIITFGKISRNRCITHKYDKRVPLMCGFSSDMAPMLKSPLLKDSGKGDQGQHHDMLGLDLT